jgi:GGDEF domain-containing protein
LHAHNNSSIITRYLYDDLTGLDERIGTLVLAPLRDSEDEPIGNLAALWRSDLVEEAEVRLHALEIVASDATAAITNAIRFHEVSALSIRDAGTGLLNRRYFAGRLDAEVERAQRSSASLTLLHVGLEGSGAASPVVDSQLKDVAELVRFELGARGEICRVGSAELAAVMRTSLGELRSAFEQIRRRLAERGDDAVINAFELDEGEDAASFFGRAMSSTAQNGRLPIGTVKL